MTEPNIGLELNADRSSLKCYMGDTGLLVSLASVTDRRNNISPIEVKSGRSYSTRSLEKFRSKFATCLDRAYVLHVKDLREGEDGTVYLPLYMAPCLVERI